MSVFELLPLLLGQAGEAPADGAANQGVQGIWSFAPAIAMAFALYFFMILRPERRKQAAQRAQLDALKKNDRVVTIGGLYGVVMNVQKESDEVTLKIDEANNTKIRVTFAAISRVLGGETAGDKTST